MTNLQNHPHQFLYRPYHLVSEWEVGLCLRYRYSVFYIVQNILQKRHLRNRIHDINKVLSMPFLSLCPLNLKGFYQISYLHRTLKISLYLRSQNIIWVWLKAKRNLYVVYLNNILNIKKHYPCPFWDKKATKTMTEVLRRILKTDWNSI